ncbi:UNVERIFIED_CONTAM: hypothetical protein K2H54_013315, partial [Gekko kuhli]
AIIVLAQEHSPNATAKLAAATRLATAAIKPATTRKAATEPIIVTRPAATTAEPIDSKGAAGRAANP